jgi:hypothetical protein
LILYPILFHILGWGDDINAMNGLPGVEHAISQGLETNGVAPAKFPGPSAW